MSNTISTLLLRNLSDVFGENDPVRRRVVIRSNAGTSVLALHYSKCRYIDAPAYGGTDFIVARNGRIASVYLFFDNLP